MGEEIMDQIRQAQEGGEMMEKIREAMSRPALPECDLNNPWPPGCDFYHRHNDLWRKRWVREREGAV